jgi:DNA mismatch repair protein MutS2
MTPGAAPRSRPDERFDGVPTYAIGTPLPLDPADVADALDTLEFFAVLDRVAAHSQGAAGAGRIRARRPTADLAWITAELALVGEAMALERQGEGLAAEDVPEVGPALGRLRVEGSVLSGTELLTLWRVLVAARRVKGELRRVAGRAPQVAALDVPLPDRALDDRLERSLEPDGSLRDSASPALARARQAVREARARLIRRLESLLHELEGPRGEGAVTVRNGRYVIPVRRDSRSRPDGIVHGESGSQGTLFLEPGAAIELGNALAEAELEEERETLRVLRELTAMLRPAATGLADAWEMCVRVDDLAARAKYAVTVGGEVPAVSPAPAPVRIHQGRHPLLLGGDVDVVPFDLSLDPAERTLLVSGPNTGGKTVLLKAVGLFALLAQSGIVPPVGAGSELPAFTRVFADIGDHQSIAANLSTFSSHVAELRRILDHADEASLALLDETGSGTDPAEGAALAAASLASLTRRGALTLATTHLGVLKTLPERLPNVVNASLEFDAASLRPTYRFRKGLPGRSYGLAIARRLGVPAMVLEEAEAWVPEAERHLDALLARAEERGRELERRLAVLEERELDAANQAARLSRQAEQQRTREEELEAREKTAERRAREQARQVLLDARREVEAAVASARAASDEDSVRDARRRLEDAIQAGRDAEEREAGRRDLALHGGAVEPGMRVTLPGGSTGEVAEIRPDGRVVVVAGSVRLVLDADAVTATSAGPSPRAQVRAASAAAREDSGQDGGATEVDLRGLTGEEAEQEILAAIDRAVLADYPYLRVIHGKGTGVVRARVHEVAKRDRRVARFGFAPANQGGSGVTVLELGA